MDRKLNSNQKHELTTVLLDFCMKELVEFRQILKEDNMLSVSKTVSSNVMIEYIKTAEKLCKLTYMDENDKIETAKAATGRYS